MRQIENSFVVIFGPICRIFFGFCCCFVSGVEIDGVFMCSAGEALQQPRLTVALVFICRNVGWPGTKEVWKNSRAEERKRVVWQLETTKASCDNIGRWNKHTTPERGYCPKEISCLATLPLQTNQCNSAVAKMLQFFNPVGGKVSQQERRCFSEFQALVWGNEKHSLWPLND